MEQRTTRPRQWTKTSRGVPRTAPGMRREKRIFIPTLMGRSISKRTPLAETFLVRAVNSTLPLARTTGSTSGKRTAQRTSWREFGGCAFPCKNGTPVLEAFIIDTVPGCLEPSCHCNQNPQQAPGHQSFREGNIEARIARPPTQSSLLQAHEKHGHGRPPP